MSLYDNDPALLEPIRSFQRELKSSEFQPPLLCGERSFPLLLAGVPALRKTPGLTPLQELGKECFTSIPYCRDGASEALAREHLSRVFHITDQASLVQVCRETLQVHQQYLDFESFWEERPAFDPAELTSEARQVFSDCSNFARQLQPFVGRRGFLAWDISETLGLLRAACACRLISRQEFDQLAQYWVDQAAAFHSWQEYALGLVCGGAYWSYRLGSSLEEIAAYVELNLRLVRQLLGDQRAWCGRLWWRRPGEKVYLLSPPELRPLLQGWESPPGCLATDRITVDGRPVGYCYREGPADGHPDSGWRFFAGDEDDAYLADAGHSGIYHLNTICNYDPGILPLLTAPTGTAYCRGEDGAFHKEPFIPPEDGSSPHTL